MESMKPIPLIHIIEVVRRVQSDRPAIYSHVAGVTCPVCGRHLSVNRPMGIYRTMARQGGKRRRYHTCPTCEANFQSVETY